MISSIPGHRFDTAIWTITAAQHFAQSNDNSATSEHHINVTRHGRRGGGASDHLLQYRNLPQLQCRGRWTSERTLERYVQEATFLLHQNRLSKEVTDRLPALAQLAPRFFAEQDHRESHHQPPQPPRCNGQGGEVYSVLCSGVEQRSFAHAVSPFGASPFTT